VCLQVRNGEPVDNADIVKFAKLFNDELTMENLERVQVGAGDSVGLRTGGVVQVGLGFSWGSGLGLHSLNSRAGEGAEGAGGARHCQH
jgi:hypothetical protein